MAEKVVSAVNFGTGKTGRAVFRAVGGAKSLINFFTGDAGSLIRRLRIEPFYIYLDNTNKPRNDIEINLLPQINAGIDESVGLVALNNNYIGDYFIVVMNNSPTLFYSFNISNLTKLNLGENDPFGSGSISIKKNDIEPTPKITDNAECLNIIPPLVNTRLYTDGQYYTQSIVFTTLLGSYFCAETSAVRPPASTAVPYGLQSGWLFPTYNRETDSSAYRGNSTQVTGTVNKMGGSTGIFYITTGSYTNNLKNQMTMYTTATGYTSYLLLTNKYINTTEVLDTTTFNNTISPSISISVIPTPVPEQPIDLTKGRVVHCTAYQTLFDRATQSQPVREVTTKYQFPDYVIPNPNPYDKEFRAIIEVPDLACLSTPVDVYPNNNPDINIEYNRYGNLDFAKSSVFFKNRHVLSGFKTGSDTILISYVNDLLCFSKVFSQVVYGTGFIPNSRNPLPQALNQNRADNGINPTIVDSGGFVLRVPNANILGCIATSDNIIVVSESEIGVISYSGNIFSQSSASYKFTSAEAFGLSTQGTFESAESNDYLFTVGANGNLMQLKPYYTNNVVPDLSVDVKDMSAIYGLEGKVCSITEYLNGILVLTETSPERNEGGVFIDKKDTKKLYMIKRNINPTEALAFNCVEIKLAKFDDLTIKENYEVLNRVAVNKDKIIIITKTSNKLKFYTIKYNDYYSADEYDNQSPNDYLDFFEEITDVNTVIGAGFTITKAELIDGSFEKPKVYVERVETSYEFGAEDKKMHANGTLKLWKGIAYTSEYESHPLVIEDGNYSSFGNEVKLNRVMLDLEKTIGGKINDKTTQGKGDYNEKAAADNVYVDSQELFVYNGIHRFEVSDTDIMEQKLKLTQDMPYPYTIHSASFTLKDKK